MSQVFSSQESVFASSQDDDENHDAGFQTSIAAAATDTENVEQKGHLTPASSSETRFEDFHSNTRNNPARKFSRIVLEVERGQTMETANQVLFIEVTTLAEQVYYSKARASLLVEFLHRHRLDAPNRLVYPLFRLLLPDLDKERARYFIKEKTLARLYVEALALPEPLARRLERYYDPSLNTVKIVGGEDVLIMNGRFPTVLKAVLDYHFRTEAPSCSMIRMPLTCFDINQFLDCMHDTSFLADKAILLRELVFAQGLRDCRQHALLARIILKESTCADARTVLDAFHPSAFRGVHVIGDLRRVLAQSSSESNMSTEHSFTYELFSPGRPMLASRVRIDKATAKLGDFLVEEKMDGDRMLVHLRRGRGEFRLFTRNQKDFTRVYGTPQLVADLFSAIECEECILDGEIVPFDLAKGNVIRCGRCINLDVAREMFKRACSRRQLCFFAFDVMMVKESLDGETRDLTVLPLWERKAILTRLIRRETCLVRMVRPMAVVRDCWDMDDRHRRMMEQLDRIILARREGLVLKALDAPYSLAGRSPSWVKIKPDYVGQLCEGLDCIVLGGEYFKEPVDRVFHGIKQVSRLVFGLRCSGRNQDEEGLYRPFCVTGMGLSSSDFAFVHRVFEERGIMSSDEAPRHFKWTGCTVWLRPEDSFIVEVSGTQMIHNRFRFPFVRRLRFDKSWDECATVAECEERFAEGYLFSGRKAIDIKRTDEHGGKTLITNQKITGDGKDVIENESEILSGKTFLVFPGEYPFFEGVGSDKEVERLIQRHGGKVRGLRDGFTADFCIAADPSHIRVRNMMRSKSAACPMILSLHFILECIRQGKVVEPFAIHHIVYPGHEAPRPSKRLRSVNDDDMFGDSFTRPATMESLAVALHRVKEQSPREGFEDDEEAALLVAAGLYLSGVTVFLGVDLGSSERDGLTVQVRLHGGRIIEKREYALLIIVASRNTCVDGVEPSQVRSRLAECQKQQRLWPHLFPIRGA